MARVVSGYGSSLICTSLIMLSIISAIFADDQIAPDSFAKWLGPQTYPKQKHQNEISLKKLQDQVFKEFSVTVQVLKGGQVDFKSAKFPILAFDNGQLKKVEPNQVALREDGQYLLGKMEGIQKLTSTVPKLTVRVIDGPLKGALVHVKRGDESGPGPGPFYSIYEIPMPITVEEGELKIQIVEYVFK